MIAWAAVVVAGFAMLCVYESTPGLPARDPPTVDPSIDAGAPPRLVAFLHPHCPCSVATVSAIAELMATHPRAISATAIFADADEPTRSDLWRRAAAIPGVRVVHDADGTLARQFGAQTSGQVLCYAGDGQLKFSGGLTAGRGRLGPSDGVLAIESIVARREPMKDQAPVYGCGLQ